MAQQATSVDHNSMSDRRVLDTYALYDSDTAEVIPQKESGVSKKVYASTIRESLDEVTGTGHIGSPIDGHPTIYAQIK